ncbi:fimbrial assembly protein [Variovorax sp. WS11]|uniref:type IV pilus modification PilV family protein n=1 Tax=Variovorax sp. WS11 TaxID=1105204 RepID=UPI000D0D3EB1|nr:fimbrial assembly protein [Variovorax sp. WS11]NDZ12664.1 fimbrial assembly protein [Variovorax sp. WS11]PSL82666.1 fimbrial assembly protein [Variovorax sp. WS11]
MTPVARPGAGRREAGIALLEVLIAILVFSFGVLGMIGLQARAIGISVDAADRNRAALLANEIASTMWLGNTVSVASGTLTAWKARVADPASGGLPSGVGTVTAVSGTTNSADIKITWRAPTRASAEGDSQLSTRVTLP